MIFERWRADRSVGYRGKTAFSLLPSGKKIRKYERRSRATVLSSP